MDCGAEYCEPVTSNDSDQETRTDTSVSENNSLLTVESILSTLETSSGLSRFSTDDSQIVFDMEKGLQYGILKRNDTYFVAEWSSNENRVIAADLNKRRLEVYENKILMNAHDILGAIDLDANGRRWEGGLRNGKPFGYGVLFSEEGRKEYDGFMFDGMKICYGVEYCNDVDRVNYKGSYYFNSRFGNGILYNRNGGVDYSGLWWNDEPYSPHVEGRIIDDHTESTAIPNDSFNMSNSFSLNSFFHSLQRIVIGDSCFGMVRVFELDGLSELENVVIRNKSFTYAKTDDAIQYLGTRADGSYRIVNCPKLQSIKIGNNSFSDYCSFALQALPFLQSIDVGNYCFYNTLSFSLTGVIN